MSTPLTQRLASEHAAAVDALPPEVVSRDLRHSAIEALAAQGLPTSRDENWKYANLRPLERVRFAPATGIVAASATGQLATALPAPMAGYARYTFVDGVFSPELSRPLEHPGVRVRSLRGSQRVVRLPAALAPHSAGEPRAAADLRFATLNEAFATDGLAINVAAGADCPACLELLFVATADATAGASYPRVEMRVEDGGRMGLIERHVSAVSDHNFVSSFVSVEVGRAAAVRHYRVQDMAARALWFDTLSAVLAEDAAYRLYGVALGALSARSTVNIRLAGERAEFGGHAASVADRQQTHDTYMLVEHAAPRARTEQSFRGIAGGRSRVAFNGKIVVRKDAQGTDSRQSLRGLLAGPEAEIDVRPQLEIYTDDVRCAHGATAGKLDDNMLFYLLSRGLEPQTAQRLLKWAFLADVVSRIEVPELRRQIELEVAGHMSDAVALKELI
jgi:Fe-S cluster assembly protein SufD